MTAQSLKSKTISSLIWKLLERGGNSLIALIVQIVMARMLAPEQFGALAIMLVFVNLGNVIVQSGLNTAIVQDPDVTENDYSTVFWMSFVISIFLFACVFAGAPYLASFYGNDLMIEPLRVLGLILVINALNAVQVAIAQRALDFKSIFRATMISVVSSGIIGIGSAIAGAGLWALVLQQLSYQAIACLVMGVQLRWRPRMVFDLARAKTLYAFGWKLLVSGLLDTGYHSLSDLIIGKMFSSATLGLVSQGKKYPSAIGSMLDGAIRPVMLSAVAHVQNDLAYVKRLVRRALKTSTFLIFPAMALFALAAEPIVRIVLGEKWLGCVPFLQMYCFIYALLPIHTANLQSLNGIGRSDVFLRLELIKKAYGIAVLCITAFVFEDVYAIIAGYMLTGILSTFVNSYPNKRIIGYSYAEQMRDILPALMLSVASAIVALPICLLGFPAAAQILAQGVVFVGVYLALAAVFHVEEFRYLASTAASFARGRKRVSS